MKKKISILETALEKSDLSDSFAESSIVQWISENGRALLWTLFGLIALFLLGYRFLGGSSYGGVADYVAADQAFNQFLAAERGEAGAKQAQENLDKLTKLLNSHPELRAKYEGRIAQSLITRENFAAALPFAERTLARLSKTPIPLYQDFAATTLLIESQQYPQALQQALSLQEKIDANKSSLMTVNLLRIATLQQQLGQTDESLKSWQRLQQLLEQGPAMMQTWKEGKLTMLDYIAFRKKEGKKF